MELTYTEENYIKSIYHLGCESSSQETSTNTIAEYLLIKPATVTSMLKRLREKEVITYQRYGKVQLTKVGTDIALQIIRKHRLWEVFLVEKLSFKWDEVHEVAEQLEHIQSEKLINKLEAFLEFPTHDPHGDPIPDIKGKVKNISKITLSQANIGKVYQVVAVKDSSSEFLHYLMQLHITLATPIKIIKKIEFDNSLNILVNKKEINVSEKFANNIFIS
ncbi:MAG TPA: metal-dependent transcriptional regulator [Chitinophagaceae bacterium]|nr:metal-dependent transcriptional regulator [Chitinophagaceae bacterium]